MPRAASLTPMSPPLLMPLLLLLLLADTQLRPAEGSYSSLSHTGGANMTEFFCKGEPRRPVPPEQICDGINDCDGREDETNCLQCKRTGWRCRTTRECVSVLNKCDGVIHCPDGSDEDRRDCLVEACHGKNRFKCANGICVDAEERCDCHPVCADGSDEWHCGVERAAACRADEFTCTLSEPRVCLRACHVCDGHMDCPHGEDEKLCARCSHGAFHCRSKVCIEHFKKCDGVEDCDGGEDELGCRDGGADTSGAARRPRHPGADGRSAADTGLTPPPLLLLVLLLQTLCRV